MKDRMLPLPIVLRGRNQPVFQATQCYSLVLNRVGLRSDELLAGSGSASSMEAACALKGPITLGNDPKDAPLLSFPYTQSPLSTSLLQICRVLAVETWTRAQDIDKKSPKQEAHNRTTPD